MINPKPNNTTTITAVSKKRTNPILLTIALRFTAPLCLLLTSCSGVDFGFNTNNTNPADDKTTLSTLITVNNTINLAQVTSDVTYLSSDELKGRDNFSSEIHIAANFIAKRFSEVGLVPAPSAPNFKQQYSVQRIKPTTLRVEINGQTIDDNALAMVTTLPSINWNSNVKNSKSTVNQGHPDKSVVNTVIIGEHENMRKALRKLNYQGGQHLVLLHPKHEKSFQRYQSYFAQGSTTLVNQSNSVQGGVIVIVLTKITNVKQYQVKGIATVSQTRLSNVVGILPGKSKINEIVLYSAHYDHLGVKSNINALSMTDDKPIDSSNIFNGADDDASGVTAIINIAHHFAKMDNNERTIMFSAFSAEELGGFGSQHFSNKVDHKNITAMINIEMIGKPAIFGEGTVWMTGMDRSNLGEQLNQALAPKHSKIYTNPYPKENLFYRSDNATLARLGVPAHSFSSTQLDKDQHYHQVSDDINSLNLPSMLQVIKTLTLATTPLVKGTITPSRIDTNKVKAKGVIF